MLTRIIMIMLERLNGTVFFLNHRLVEVVEETPDTIITLTNGHKYLVRNKLEDVITMIRTEGRD